MSLPPGLATNGAKKIVPLVVGPINPYGPLPPRDTNIPLHGPESGPLQGLPQGANPPPPDPGKELLKDLDSFEKGVRATYQPRDSRGRFVPPAPNVGPGVNQPPVAHTPISPPQPPAQIPAMPDYNAAIRIALELRKVLEVGALLKGNPPGPVFGIPVVGDLPLALGTVALSFKEFGPLGIPILPFLVIGRAVHANATDEPGVKVQPDDNITGRSDVRDIEAQAIAARSLPRTTRHLALPNDP